MALSLPGFCLESSTTTGTGTFSLAGPETGVSGMTFRSLVSGAGSGSTVCYAIYGAGEWEIGLGTVTSGGPDTLSRVSVLESSNGDSKVNFSAGKKLVAVDVSGRLMEQLLDAAMSGVPERTSATTWSYIIAAATGRSLLGAANAPAARTILGLAALATMGIALAGGLEDDGSANLRLKLNGATLDRSVAGTKVADKGIGLGQMADQTQGGVIVAGAGGVATLALPTAAGQVLISGPSTTPYFGLPDTDVRYDSGLLTVSNGGSVAMADHNLGGKPRSVRVTLYCVTAVAGYSVGQEVEVAPYNWDGNNGRGCTVTSDAAQIGANIGANGIYIPNRSSGGAIMDADLTKWRLRIRAKKARADFLPDDLGSLLLGWWDAEHSDLITQSGGLVSSWKDRVAGYDLAQATGASRPTYMVTGFGGRPGIYGDGVDDCLELASSPFPSGASPVEIWALVDQTALVADTTVRYLFRYGGGGAANTRGLRRNVVSGVNRLRADTADGSATVSGNENTVDLSGRKVVGGIITGTAITAQVGSVAGTAAAVVSNTTSVRTRLFANNAPSAANFWQGGVAALLVTSTLTSAQRLAVVNYLTARA